MLKKLTLWPLIIIGGAMGFTLHSSAFQTGEQIPKEYTCKGANISPPLTWSDQPSNTQSYVLIMDDPDASNGTWDHWILFNIPALVHELPTNIQSLPAGTKIGKNSFQRNNYGGPCPPSGNHRYFLKLYALDTTLNLNEDANKAQIEKVMQGHILANAQLIGEVQHQK